MNLKRWALVILLSLALLVLSYVFFIRPWTLQWVLHFLFQRALGFTLADVAANPETYLLWLGLPSLIFIAAGGIASRQWNLQQTPRA